MPSGKEVSATTPLWSAIPPGLGSNSFFQANNERIGAPVKFNILNGNDYGDKLGPILAAGNVPGAALHPELEHRQSDPVRPGGGQAVRGPHAVPGRRQGVGVPDAGEPADPRLGVRRLEQPAQGGTVPDGRLPLDDDVPQGHLRPVRRGAAEERRRPARPGQATDRPEGGPVGVRLGRRRDPPGVRGAGPLDQGLQRQAGQQDRDTAARGVGGLRPEAVPVGVRAPGSRRERRRGRAVRGRQVPDPAERAGRLGRVTATAAATQPEVQPAARAAVRPRRRYADHLGRRPGRPLHLREEGTRRGSRQGVARRPELHVGAVRDRGVPALHLRRRGQALHETALRCPEAHRAGAEGGRGDVHLPGRPSGGDHRKRVPGLRPVDERMAERGRQGPGEEPVRRDPGRGAGQDGGADTSRSTTPCRTSTAAASR